MRHPSLLVVAAAVLLTSSCSPEGGRLDTRSVSSRYVAGDGRFVRPLDGLSKEHLEQFKRGRALFDKVFTPATGLGPLFNNVSCKACHGFPNSGGASAEPLTLIAGEDSGAPRTLKEKGGPVISDRAVLGVPREQFPVETLAISVRISPVTYGAGLIEAIPVTDLRAQLEADAAREKLGIKAKANVDVNAVGRFGWKAQTASLRDFTITACNFEMGLTTKERPYEFFPNLPPQKLASPSMYGNPQYPFVKAFFDARGPKGRQPDLSDKDVDDLTAFQRFQAPPPPLPPTAQSSRGKALFGDVGCAACHRPEFRTGKNDLGIPAGAAVPLYSDLLLHDMGPDMSDGIRWQAAATATEWRTTPLWGLRYRKRFIHDGRTDSLEEAIQVHGGEGQKVVDAYNDLDQAGRDAIKAFLLSI